MPLGREHRRAMQRLHLSLKMLGEFEGGRRPTVSDFFDFEAQKTVQRDPVGSFLHPGDDRAVWAHLRERHSQFAKRILAVSYRLFVFGDQLQRSAGLGSAGPASTF